MVSAFRPEPVPGPQRLRPASALVCAAPPRGAVDLSAKRLDPRFPGFHPGLGPWSAETPFLQRWLRCQVPALCFDEVSEY